MRLSKRARQLMHLNHLYLRNFRNYEEETVTFRQGLNAICGGNAQGKTNLLEAISLISTGRSFRTQHLSELIREGSSFFYLEAEIVRDCVTQTVKMSFDGQNRRLQLNANSFTTFHPLLGILPTIFAVPDDIELIAGAPAYRRRFLNLHLAQSDPLYVHHLSRYWRAMKQRNSLLRSKSIETIECWEMEMAQSASYLSKARQTLFDDLKEPLTQQSKHLSREAEAIEIRYHSTHSSEPGVYLKQMQKTRSREKELGMTLNGPHRDDLSFWIASKPVRTFASEGQKKTAVTALRLAQWRCFSNKLGTPPLLSIDDFGWPLDDARQRALWNFLQSMGQVFLTTPQKFEGGHTLLVQKGKIT